MSAPVFKLYACCVPVRGARRSTICDLQRGAVRLIPNGLYEILTAHRGRPLGAIKAAYGPAHDATIDQYFAFLAEHELGFWCDDPAAFPELDLAWEAPEPVTNAIVDVGGESAHDFAAIFAQLDALGCRALQLRVFCALPIDALERVLRHTDRGRLRGIELLVRYTPEYDDATLRRLADDFPRVYQILVHAAPVSRPVEADGPAAIRYVAQAVDSEAHCGEVHPAYFTSTVDGFAEALAHNSCLNRKISVDQHGEIRNCPSLPDSYGNAATTPLRAALDRPEFRRLWAVTKDQVETCRDCEFRYVCTDCRAYVAPSGHAYRKPAKCGYDPYTARWDASRAEAMPVAQAARAARAPLPVLSVGPASATSGA
jgi:SPASM domain peptide maturase of grasp-with-spasm system